MGSWDQTIGVCLIFLSVAQVPFTYAGGTCKITSITSTGPSSLNVKWERHGQATHYFLDLRVINAAHIAPIVLTLIAPTGAALEKEVFGLRPGAQYSVTLKVFQFYSVVCQDTLEASTVPATSQIIHGSSLSSTSIRLEWAQVTTANSYYITLEPTVGERRNVTVNDTSVVVTGLSPKMVYKCSVYTVNKAGRGSKSAVKAVLTLVPPPTTIEAQQTGSQTARVSWQPMSDILLYEVTVWNQDQPLSEPLSESVSGTYLDMDVMSCSSYLISVSSVNQFLQAGEPNNHSFTTDTVSPVTGVSVEYTCSSNAALVSWVGVTGADSYRVEANSTGSARSCFSQGTQCLVEGMDCSQTYLVSVIAIANSCESTENSDTSTFQTAPCAPEGLDLYRECSTNVIVFSWSQTNHTDHYMAYMVDSTGDVQPCMTEDSSCFFTRVVCGRNYSFTVKSVSDLCSSQPSLPVSINSGPCLPDSFVTTSTCSSDTLINSWLPSDGVKSYVVEAHGNLAETDFYNCSSDSLSCTIHGLQCGQHLTTSLTVFDDECASSTLLGIVAETVPCPPQNVSATMDCGANSITLNWTVALGALFYIGSVVDDSGRVFICQAVQTSCQITGLECSTRYTAFVTSSSINCNSSESERVSVETAACPPDNIVASLDCAANQAQISWDGQPAMQSYTATIKDPEDRLLSCSTTTTSCPITNLHCGQRYKVSVFHHDGICPSMPSSPIYMDSVACGPANVSARANCTTGNLEVVWSAAQGVEGYTAVLTRGDRQRLYCNSTEPLCRIDTMDCGHEYSLEVMSISGSCLSFPSNRTVVREAPCVPTNLSVERNCDNSSANVTWLASLGAALYEVRAVAVDLGERLGCTSNTSAACRLEDLPCGRLYAVSVVAVGEGCSSRPSDVVTLRTVPCPPSQLKVSLDCNTNNAALSWNSSASATSYSARAVGADGHVQTCQGLPQPGCVLEGLRCGQGYVFTAVAMDGGCLSAPSQPVWQTTAPCVPTSVVNTVNCTNNTLAVSWTPVSSPVTYEVVANSTTTSPLSCSSLQAECVVDGLECGQQYSVSVRAVEGQCPGPSSAEQLVRSAPCMPSSVRQVLECSSNTVQASWDPSAGANSYVATLTDGHNFSASCSTSLHGCSFPNVRCAGRYGFTVVALDNQCESPASLSPLVSSAPCDPENVVATLDCVSGVTTVTWTASAGNISHYTVLATATGQPQVRIRSNATSCTLAHLQCGEEYTVVVLAEDGACTSSLNASTTVATAPCAPQIQSNATLLQCSNNQALVTWAEDYHATSFVVTATADDEAPSTCSTTNTSCVLDDLACGRRYTAGAVAHGPQCTSDPSVAFEILTAPCVPINVEYLHTCGSPITLISWDESRGRESFRARVSAAEHEDSCTTAETHCSIRSLRCGTLYNVSVDAVAAHCNSGHTSGRPLQTAPCAPQNVSASLVCSENTGMVTWLSSVGAVAYTVTALGRDGDSKECSSNTTTCSLPNMHCGQTYTITVTPSSDTCTGYTSNPIVFVAGACPPISVQVSLRCEGSVGSVSWLPAGLSDWHQAWATGVDGHSHACNATGSGAECSFIDLHCGESYAVTVATTERGCQSEPSAPVTLKTALCPPTNITGVTTCGSNVINVTWSPSPERNAVYNVHVGGDSFVVPENFYTHQETQCGQNASFVLTAQHTCTSAFSQTLHVPAIPCEPTYLNASAQCGTEMGLLTWTAGAGATYYVATVTGDNGHVASCSSNGTSCSARLECGQHYRAAVLSHTSACPSINETTFDFYSAPCLPQNIEAVLDCDSNAFAVQWDFSPGDVLSYMALAMGSDGSRFSCNTTSGACSIGSLHCGVTYSIAVIPSNADCGSIQSADYQIQSAPCTPQGEAVELECSTNVALVTWSPTGPDQIQEVTAVGSRGHTAACNSSSTNCTFSQLRCGETYSLTVVGHTQGCQGIPSSTLSLHTAPCVPTFPAAHLDCSTNIAVVTWDSALGAVSYTVLARGGPGHNFTCVHSDTTCAFSDLRCGQDYNLTVVATNPDHCGSLPSETITTTTAPCPQSALQTSLECGSNTAVVSWTPGLGILNYSSSAEAMDTVHHQNCSTVGPGCNISSLLCGERYRVSVTGMGRNCRSPSDAWSIINTAPCQPTMLDVRSACDSDTISVSWSASQGSDSYRAVAEASDGSSLDCTAGSTDCQIAGLLCGQRYQVYVVGMSADCLGARSHVHVVNTAPCVPRFVHTELDCLSGSLNITWQQSSDALAYIATAMSGTGQVVGCETTEPHCMATNLQCGMNFSVSVVARDASCNSSSSPAQLVATAPCPPMRFDTLVDCATNELSVAWNHSMDGVLYTATAVSPDGGLQNCSAAHTSCSFSTLECGTQYNVTITPSSRACVGSQSHSQLFRTAPCVPRLRTVEMDCLSESAFVVWEDPTHDPPPVYIVVSTDSRGHVQRFNCNATDAVCAVPGMTCGRRLNFTLMAGDQQCSSAASNVMVTETAPCPPLNVNASVGCENRTASVSWSPSPGALSYTATLEHMEGQTTCCSTAGTTCDITDLPCGKMFVLLVTAEGLTCNSSQSAGTIIRTEPCTPQNLQASLSCGTNVASVTWEPSLGGQQYRVEARGSNGSVSDVCENYEGSCELRQLACGEIYTATVVAEDSDCTSAPSDSVQIRTVPCTPVNVSTRVDCEDNQLSVRWSQGRGADSHTAFIVDANGQSSSCQAMAQVGCNLTGLSCGQMYRVTVVASNGYCDSAPTYEVETHSAPCETGNIQALMDCITKTALLTWRGMAGAEGYTVTAQPQAVGGPVFCNTSQTVCEMDGLQCGQSYSISVTTHGQTCDSAPAQMSGELLTEPCVPSHVSTEYSLMIGQVLWDGSPGTDRYTATAVTSGGVAVSCSTADTYCALPGLGCSELYNVSVIAHNRACNDSAESEDLVVIETEPCPPNNVGVQVECESASATVTWEMSAGALGYVATLDGRNGHTLSCNSSSNGAASATATHCTVEGVHCGTVYYVRVVALGAGQNSSDSNTVLLESAPCLTEQVELEAQVDCNNHSASVSWGWVDGALSYELCATASDGHTLSTATDQNFSQLTGLLCGQVYSLALTAINAQCQSQSHSNVTISTRPCAPLRVGVDLQCGTSTASLYWEHQESVETYVASANSSSGGHVLHCTTENGTCQFSGLNCGTTYQFSVVANSSTCQSDVSSTVEIQTEPCLPVIHDVNGTCDSKTVRLDWTEAPGAVVYLITATGDLGYITSYQTNDTMLEVELLCGQSYSFTVRGQGDHCDGPHSGLAHFTMAPCVPYHLDSFTQCEDSLGSVSWGQSDGADSYTAVAIGEDGHAHMCTTSNTSCTWDDLHCGEDYVVHVLAHNHRCPSPPSNSTSIHMAPCIPEGLEASLDCSTMVATLTWNSSKAADIYSVTAQASGREVLALGTNDTVAQFSEFVCGEEYFLSVQAVDSVCRSAPSPPIILVSAPCPPTAISSSMDCLSNIAVVTWQSSAGAEFYTAKVTDIDGQSQSCLSASQQCGLPNVICGTNYTVEVVASRESCESYPSEPSALQSVPCVPTGVIISMDCGASQAAVSWSDSKGGLSYAVSAMSALGATAECNSADPHCTLTNLTCGQSYRVQVLALDNICSSLPSRAAMFSTEPCQPTITAAVLDCFSNSALLEWTHSEGALSYVTTGRAGGNGVVNCTTNFTSCELGNLTCGQTYSLTTVALGPECDSQASSSVEFTSVPCPPSSVTTELDCSANAARVTWQPAGGADSYLVQAYGVEEDVVRCQSNQSTDGCLLPGLMCGFTYHISVLAINSQCNVSESDIVVLDAGPCVPNLLQADLDCDSGGVAVSWEASHGALFYTAVAQGNGGYSETCRTAGTTCVFSALLCGLSYSVTARATGESCSSAQSAPLHFHTVPCAPQSLAAVMHCSNDTGLVSWEQTEGGVSYQVRALGADGHAPECTSTADHCQLPSMHCGQLYVLTVTVLDGVCDNVRINSSLQSVPCRPANVRTSMPPCPSALASVTWEHASGASSYAATVMTAGGNSVVSCNATSATSCQLSQLLCGQTYNVSVVARDEECDSMESEVTPLTTAPCPPQGVALAMNCGAGRLAVSWSPDPDADSFIATFVSNTVARHTCLSNGTTCLVEDLPCGQNFSVSVVTVRAGCRSEASAPLEISSAPCVPLNPEGRLDCVTNTAWVSWDSTAGAFHYTVVAESVNGDHNSSCTSPSSDPSCHIPSLKCGTEYIFFVIATNDDCQSNSDTFTLETGPCALENITVGNECGSNRIMVRWQMAAEAPLYLVTAEAHDQSLISCNSSSPFCELQGASCSMTYTVIVSASSDKCNSLRSTPIEVTTAPCVPRSVVVGRSCQDDGVVVSWSQSTMAKSFLLTATGESGDVRECDTAHNNCTLANLPCGQMYTVNVTASDDNCTSSPSADIFFETVPCAPTDLSVDYQCETNSAALSWTPSDGGLEYYAYASSELGVAQLLCNTTDVSCTVGLTCGSVHNLSVVASDRDCNSAFSMPVWVGAAPCAPSGVKVRVRMVDDLQLAMATWPSVNCSDVQYLVALNGRIKDDPQAVMELLSYPTERLAFEFPVPCSTVFNLTVQALNDGGVSNPSVLVNGITAPCTPDHAIYSGDSQSATVSWEASVFATQYAVYNGSGVNRTVICNTTELSCQVTGLEASSVEVTASNAVGESNPNTNVTGPVQNRNRRDLRNPEGFANNGKGLAIPQVVHKEVMGTSIRLGWTAVQGATMYTVIVREDQVTRPTVVLTVDTDFYLASELRPLTRYCFILLAKNALHQSAFSTPECVSTGVAK